MQYVRSLAGSVNGAWNSINPATLSGAIDVLVVEQEDGSLACSPFHIRFGKWRLLRPYEKKVEFSVNGRKQDLPMKLGEGGEAFFVFETNERVPEALQTSPPVSPVVSPQLGANAPGESAISEAGLDLREPEPFELEDGRLEIKRRRSGSQNWARTHGKSASFSVGVDGSPEKAQSDGGRLTPPSPQQFLSAKTPRRPLSTDMTSYAPKLERHVTDSDIPTAKAAVEQSLEGSRPLPGLRDPKSSSLRTDPTDRSPSPPPTDIASAKSRAMNLSKRLWTSNISNQVTESGDLMLDMTSYKSSDGEALHAELIARQLLSEEIDGPYDIGSLIGADENGNIWIYSSEEAKEAAGNKAAKALDGYNPTRFASSEALLDQGYHSSDDIQSSPSFDLNLPRTDTDSALGSSRPSSPGQPAASLSPQTPSGDPNKNYAKTLRLTSQQLHALNLTPGANPMSFTVNRATCTANLWLWRHDVPIVISDIDGTITKSDVLGHVMNSIGRDWTHPGVAKLYTEIAANGYNFLYLTSRSVGQADTTRNYLDGIVQDGSFRLPRGPVVLSPDRTIAALRREVYLRKPEVFKMNCLRDIMALFAGHMASNHLAATLDARLKDQVPFAPNTGIGTGRGRGGSPFYAGFGNRLTDALSYRSVNIPSTRIFTINSYSEVSLDLLSLNNYKLAYGSMREIVDYYFPPVGLLIGGGGEDFTDFNFWRDRPLGIEDFADSASESDGEGADVDVEGMSIALSRLTTSRTRGSVLSEDEAGDGDVDEMMESYLSDARVSLEESLLGSAGFEEGEVDSLAPEDEMVDEGAVDEVVRPVQLSLGDIVRVRTATDSNEES